MSLRSAWTCVLWDVDGTIVDASEGILRRLTITLEHFGKPAPRRIRYMREAIFCQERFRQNRFGPVAPLQPVGRFADAQQLGRYHWIQVA